MNVDGVAAVGTPEADELPRACSKFPENAQEEYGSDVRRDIGGAIPPEKTSCKKTAYGADPTS